MQYITQCPPYSSVITTPFQKDNYLHSRLLKSSRSVLAHEESLINAALRDADS